MSVSRETPAPPPVAVQVFGDRLPVAVAYTDLLATAGVERGLIGPREVPRLWDRHLLNCGVVAAALPRDADVADIGSGAGLPGLVWAIARPDLRVTLIEPLLRRTTFLEEAVRALELLDVQVLRGRAEDTAGQYDVVTSRAVAPLAKLVAWSMPLTRPGGTMWAIKGSSAAEEIERDRRSIRKAGGTEPRVTTYGEGSVATPTTVLQIDRMS